LTIPIWECKKKLFYARAANYIVLSKRGGGAAAGRDSELAGAARAAPVGEIVDSLGMGQPGVEVTCVVLAPGWPCDVRVNGRRML